MRYQAVIFDLYGTLVGEFMGARFLERLREMAVVLEVPQEDFLREWSASAVERQTGLLGDITENLVTICERAGHRPSPEGIGEALEIRDAMYRQFFVPRAGAEETLRELKASGHPLGLISMCAPDTPRLWQASVLAQYVDATVFSSETGLRKPDPEIYFLACERLGVEAPGCLYIGDGAYGELAGAAALGMHAVLIRDPAEELGIERPEEESWDGPAISSLREVLGLVEQAS
ncbi:MAG: HAD family hydrolase [Actinomycetota bacterium]